MIVAKMAKALAALALLIWAFAAPAFADEKKVACVIRHNGTAWEVLSNGGHTPLGCSSIVRYEVSPGVYGLRLSYGFTASKVHSLIIGSDESWAGVYHAGASVGLAFSNIYVKDSDGNMVDPDAIGTGGNFFVMGLFD